MARSSLMLIAALTVASFFTQSAAGQFTLPKIKLPKITKTEAPATPNNPGPVSRTPGLSSPVRDGDVRGKPIPGARITFSNNPDGSNPKTSFSSSEFIYGRLDLGGKTVYDAFGLKNLGEAKFYSVHYHLNILQPGKEAWEHDWHNGVNYTLMTKEDAQKTYWNFDVLPDPAKISTLIGAIDDDLSYFNSAGGFYSQWYDADSARSKFPQSGTYTIDIVLFGNSYDDWANRPENLRSSPPHRPNLPFNSPARTDKHLSRMQRKQKMV